MGGLPLALHLAGTYLASPFARWQSFTGYRDALDSAELPAALSDIDREGAQARATITLTWDVSLDALAREGQPQARVLLMLLSCFAAMVPIPLELLLQPDALRFLLSHDADNEGNSIADTLEQRVRKGLRALASVGLIENVSTHNEPESRAVAVHPVVADANRSAMLTSSLPPSPSIWDAAVRLLDLASRELRQGHPADWPVWRVLIPHITALLEFLGEHLGDEGLVTLLGITYTASDALWTSGNRTAAERLARASMNAARRLGDDHPACLNACQSYAAKIAGQGHYGDAERLYRQVHAGQRRVLGNNHHDTLKTRIRLAWAVMEQGRYREAEGLYRRMLPSQRRVLGENHPDAVGARQYLAQVVGLQGRYHEAEKLYVPVLRDRMRMLGERHPVTLTARYELARVIGLQGRYSEAEQRLRQVGSDQREVLGDDHPDTLRTRFALTRYILQQGRHDEAEQRYRNLLADQRRTLGDDHPDTLSTRVNLAWVIALRGRHGEAEEHFRDLLPDQQRTGGPDHPNTLTTFHTLTWVIALQGRYSEAEQQYHQVLADRSRVLGADHPSTLATRIDLAWVISLQNRYPEAEQMYLKVLADQERVLGEDHPDTKATRRSLQRLASYRETSGQLAALVTSCPSAEQIGGLRNG